MNNNVLAYMTPPQVDKSCFVCNNTIDSKSDFFYLNRKSNKLGLYFHVDCFNNNAGSEYADAMEKHSQKCYICSSSLGGAKNICRPCQASGPKCKRCNHEMTLRFAKATGKPFWGCTSFPVCKNAQNYFPQDNKTYLNGPCQTENFAPLNKF